MKMFQLTLRAVVFPTLSETDPHPQTRATCHGLMHKDHIPVCIGEQLQGDASVGSEMLCPSLTQGW